MSRKNLFLIRISPPRGFVLAGSGVGWGVGSLPFSSSSSPSRAAISPSSLPFFSASSASSPSSSAMFSSTTPSSSSVSASAMAASNSSPLVVRVCSSSSKAVNALLAVSSFLAIINCLSMPSTSLSVWSSGPQTPSPDVAPPEPCVPGYQSVHMPGMCRQRLRVGRPL